MAYLILSFCGGGIRGYFSAKVLERLTEESGVPVTDLSNMLAGTSTGGLIISEIINGKKPADIVASYVGLLPLFKLLSDDQTKPAGDIANYFDALHTTHGNKTLSDVDKNLLLTSFDLGRLTDPSQSDSAIEYPWGPALFHNFPNSPYLDTNLALALTATGAMPGGDAPVSRQSIDFDSYNIAFPDQLTALVDGAFVHHDPTVFAVCQAIDNGHALSDIYVLDFDTCFFDSAVVPNNDDGSPWGAQQWTSTCTPYTPALLKNGTANPAFSLFMNGNTSTTMSDLATTLLGDRYCWLQQPVDTFIPEYASEKEVLTIMDNAAQAVDLTAAIKMVKQLAQDQ